MEEDFILGKVFSFAAELDSGEEMQLETVNTTNNYYHFITKDQAVDLIHHLRDTFDIRDYDL